MMNYLSRGDVVQHNGKWLIVDISNDFCLFVLLETSKTKIICSRITEVLQWLECEEEAKLFCKDNDINPSTYSIETEAAIRINDRMRSMAMDIINKDEHLFWLADRKQRAEFIYLCAQKYDVSEYTVRRFLHDYLQNNLSLRNIECGYFRCGGKGKMKTYNNGKRPGPRGISMVTRDEKVISYFETARKKYLRSNTKLTYAMLYSDLVQKHYSTRMVVNGDVIYEPYAAVDRPTLRQLIYHIHTHMSDAEEYEAEHGKRVANNNIRPLHSDTIAALTHKTIGSRYEMDEMETDFYLVSRTDRTQTIGRAIMYMVVDVYSKMIVGVHVGLENNSWDAAKLALLNMVEDKVAVCARTGIEIEENDWPVSGVLPYQIMSDNGAEYLSIAFEKYACENGIALTHPPTRMASYKPNIEQKFNQFNENVKGYLPGEIFKDSYGAKHISDARLTIEEFYKIVLHFILYYNKTPLCDYQADREIFEAGIITSPINIWNFKMQKTTALKKVQDMDAYKYSLLKEANATITREGIVFKNIIYSCDDIVWLSRKMQDVNFNGRSKLKIRYDQRNMDFIYFILNGQIIRGWINRQKTANEKYVGCSLADVIEINKLLKELGAEAAEVVLKNKINFSQKIKEIVKESKKAHYGWNSGKNIRENRETEKRQLHKETQICLDIGTQTTLEESQYIEEKDNSLPGKDVTEIDVSKLSTEELFELYRKQQYEEYLQSLKKGDR